MMMMAAPACARLRIEILHPANAERVEAGQRLVEIEDLGECSKPQAMPVSASSRADSSPGRASAFSVSSNSSSSCRAAGS